MQRALSRSRGIADLALVPSSARSSTLNVPLDRWVTGLSVLHHASVRFVFQVGCGVPINVPHQTCSACARPPDCPTVGIMIAASSRSNGLVIIVTAVQPSAYIGPTSPRSCTQPSMQLAKLSTAVTYADDRTGKAAFTRLSTREVRCSIQRTQHRHGITGSGSLADVHTSAYRVLTSLAYIARE